MSTEEDYSKLPLEDRLVHKIWKVRLGAYDELSDNFAKSAGENDTCFAAYLSNPSLFKKIAGDSNVVAQESGIAVINNFLQYCGPNACLKIRSQVVAPLVEKGLASSRAGSKSKTIEALHLLIELDEPTPVIEEITPYLKHRLPKLVAGTANALYELLKSFGTNTIDPKFILPHLPKLFSHADKKVRIEATNIAIELYKWMGKSIEALLLNDLKVVQQKELSAEFEKLGDVRPQQTRLLRSQQEQLSRYQNQNNNKGNGENQDDDDVNMTESGSSEADPFDLVAPTDVLSKIPASLPIQIKSSKWKERKEILEEIQPLFKELKYKLDDYSEFIKTMAKCMKDVNLQVVQLAAEITDSLAKGLRSDFNKYLPLIFVPVLERTKEKKPQVLDPLLNLLDTMFKYSSLSITLEDTIGVLQKSKIPKVKEEVHKFLTKCLSKTPVIPTQGEIEMIMNQSIKTSADSQAPVRNAAQETIGTLMKVVGERPLNQYMDKFDDIKRKKIKEFFEKAEVSVKPTSAVSNNAAKRAPTGKPVGKKPPSRNPLSGNPRLSIDKISPPPTVGIESGLKKKNMASIPSKREASSPLKRNDVSLKSSRGLTSMVINKSHNGSSLTSKLENVAFNSNFSAISVEELKELEQLRTEKQSWVKQKQELQNSLEISSQEKKLLQTEMESFKLRYQQLVDETTGINLKLKSKDTQISRLIVDYEKSQQTLFDLQEKYSQLQKSKNSISRMSMPSTSQLAMNFSSTPKFSNLDKSKRNSTLGIMTKSGGGFGQPIAFSKQHSRPSHSPTPPSNHSPNQESGLPSNTKSLANDINTGVGKLTIEEKENTGISRNKSSSFRNDPRPTGLNTDNDEEWKRANEVTINLKARIEKMKYRSRNI
ncbi:Stu2 protein [Saccharomycopsis crataegensis]|uniref:Stu2 protein n=1 Tax=Saccharomycopsis crataegensis TaxID=43959 RepID=A0AAV5QG93_9ASCO|nr:Stu2 protein [Saccharomycopsis crataegensis]